MKRRLFLAAAITTGAACATVPVASAEAATVGSESMTIVFAGLPGAPGLVIARGVVTDVGTLTPSDSDVDTLVFRDGTLQIRESGTTSFVPPTRPACIARFSTRGTYTIVGGTGRFAHAAGSGTSRDSGLERTNRTSTECGQEGLFVQDTVVTHGALTLTRT